MNNNCTHHKKSTASASSSDSSHSSVASAFPFPSLVTPSARAPPASPSSASSSSAISSRTVVVHKTPPNTNTTTSSGRTDSATYENTFQFVENLTSSASLINTDPTTSHLSDIDPETSEDDNDGVPMSIDSKFAIAIGLSMQQCGSQFSVAEGTCISLHLANSTLFSAEKKWTLLRQHRRGNHFDFLKGILHDSIPLKLPTARKDNRAEVLKNILQTGAWGSVKFVQK